MVRLFSLLNLSQCSISGGEVTLWVKLVTFTTCAQCRLVLQHRTCRSVVLTDATGPSPANLRALTAFPVYSRWLTLGDGHVVNKPKIVVQPEFNARRGDRPIIRWVSRSDAAERKPPITPYDVETVDEF